ncbi:hypothetical protein CHLNCDRAFT_133259 [Chlorella variabilis]|uniref:Uncharacterized protein n=1 Tax=Chlorella variabilis TaxID=554065 RepID=E1Z2Q5_CHLVA|nr:hypothetical protein CHLNCDRAFT_133259 [Chlorella variabilis]EFN59703.1 hypothetical protein CHLNCDRAFT_133259 [Chlorella variabilis]|eukprot:XP_005851805.1 hypothetical protein CHLNCDRAFT_133259 [Chlorella variabilis]
MSLPQTDDEEDDVEAGSMYEFEEPAVDPTAPRARSAGIPTPGSTAAAALPSAQPKEAGGWRA